jgi:uncharacterized integral membrane protein (TIGR00698 family)
MNYKIVVLIGALIACAIPNVISSSVALLLGIFYSIFIGNEQPKQTSKWGGYLLKTSIIGLGFGINLNVLFNAGKENALITSCFVFGTLGFGFFLAKWIGLPKKIGLLISTGSAICGGSAIAAVGSVTKANSNELSVSTGVVFLLNALALISFPAIGHLLNLSEQQFGTFAAIAIHDMSSVVGAASKFGETALQVASITKMLRVLWIIPVVLVIAFKISDSKDGLKIPSFIILFIIASCIYSLLPQYQQVYSLLYKIAKQLMIVSLFLVGTTISVSNLKQVGKKVIIHATLLWVLICSLAYIYVKLFIK